MAVCRACGSAERPHEARGLCRRCYQHHRHRGTLARFPRGGEAWRRVPGAAIVCYRPRPGASAIWLLPGKVMEG